MVRASHHEQSGGWLVLWSSATSGIQGKSGEKSKDSGSSPCLQPKEKARDRREMRQRYQASVVLKFCYGPKRSH